MLRPSLLAIAAPTTPKKGGSVNTSRNIGIWIGAGVALLFAWPAWAEGGRVDCQGCHEKAVHASAYEASAHKDLACTACHVRDEAVPLAAANTEACVATFKGTDCARCHAKAVKEHQGSVHNGKRLPIDCARCHANIHTIQPHKTDKLAIVETCSECHTHESPYFESVHYLALKKGHKDAPTCTDCHCLHAIAKIDNDAKGRDFHTKACLKCHDDTEMMERNKVTTIAGPTYFNSFHGKNVQLGYPEKVAGCADCHTAHEVRKADDPKASVNKANLVDTCGKCHTSAGASFAQYAPHAEDGDKKKYPALYWTRIAMQGLLIGTFLFFWLHSLLWALRSFVERQRKPRVEGHVAAVGTQKVYRRFQAKHIALHLVVVTSFLTLALTGLPLKFHGTGWGKMLMDTFGGAVRARTIHHAAAVVTFGYFLVAIGMSIRFLLTKENGKRRIFSRLVGPDSLFPNLRDWRDLKAMFRWFFFAGPKPTFERWTYWEKFDFMAVFWGMFAIGGSGLLLWFPVFFSGFVPGWMFNIATIVHSDEALLATGFIFTVHFFNTHFRPEKFPMDPVIFNGRVSEEEMREERGDQLARYEAEGITPTFEEKGAGSLLWEVAFRLFGFTAVAIGLSLAVGMVYALLFQP